jgi:quercetin dioxygenase-like cupin family protein
MSISLVRTGTNRTTVTPNATMVTLASPATSGTTDLSVWRTSMTARSSGPVHRFDTEQVWTLLEGRADFTVDDTVLSMHEGDTVTVAANVVRQVHAITDCQFIVSGRAATQVHVAGEDEPRPVPEWIG